MVSWWYWLVYLYTDHKISLIIQAPAKNVSIMCFWTINSASLSGIRKQLQKGVSWNLLEILSIFMYLVLVSSCKQLNWLGSNFVFISEQFKLQVYVSVTHLNFRFLISLQPNVIDHWYFKHWKFIRSNFRIFVFGKHSLPFLRFWKSVPLKTEKLAKSEIDISKCLPLQRARHGNSQNFKSSF